jgi:hypothetical protein
MFYTSFYVPVVAGEVKLAFAAGVQATLIEVSAVAAGAKAAKLSIGAAGAAALKDESTGKKGVPEVFRYGDFPDGQPLHVKRGDVVEITLKGGEEKAPVEGVTIVLTLG